MDGDGEAAVSRGGDLGSNEYKSLLSGAQRCTDSSVHQKDLHLEWEREI